MPCARALWIERWTQWHSILTLPATPNWTPTALPMAFPA
nr:MAG TPA: hypothetical protein [Caudoviricetes sp.]DAQ98079.1 MAG TPA: hypothetical protein [Caudoviricetes sp.]